MYKCRLPLPELTVVAAFDLRSRWDSIITKTGIMDYMLHIFGDDPIFLLVAQAIQGCKK